MTRNTALIAVLGLALCGCGSTSGPGRPDQVVSPNLDSGVTSSNGGGQRALGNVDTMSVGPNGARPQTSVGQGRTY